MRFHAQATQSLSSLRTIWIVGVRDLAKKDEYRAYQGPDKAEAKRIARKHLGPHKVVELKGSVA